MKWDAPKDEKRMLNIGANICCFPLCVLAEYMMHESWEPGLSNLAPVRKINSLLSQKKDKEFVRRGTILPVKV